MSPELKTFLASPMRVGGRAVPGRLFLAPLSKLGNTAFREVVSGFGGHGLLFSEMCWASSVLNGPQPQGGFMWRTGEDLSGVVCQIFGCDPPSMARAARRIEAEGFFGVDINFGCSVAAVCSRGCGAALLKTPDRAEAIVDAVRRAISIPLFVKFRTGWSEDPNGAAEMAKRFENAGADALTYHPRVAPDRRTRPPRWDYIAHVKAAVDIPVIGNGDVFTREDCRRLIEASGCDGVALGRLALAKPWVFARWARGYDPGPGAYLESALSLLEGLVRHFGETVALRRFHRYAAFFSGSFVYGHTLYRHISGARDVATMAERLKAFLSGPVELLARPNMGRFR
ncbi:MAG: tRNA dihydrouridine synthase [Desulfobacterales bacterium]